MILFIIPLLALMPNTTGCYMQKPPIEVTEHFQDIEDMRALIEGDVDQHPIEFYLSLLQVESGGREDLEDKDSYIGPMQIGDAYLDDARDHAKKHYPHLLHLIPDGREALRSDARTSILVVMLHMEKWQARHGWNLYRMAALHKGGVGTAAKIRAKINGGMSIERAIHWVSTKWKYSNTHKNPRKRGKLIVPRTYLYVYGYDPHTGAREPRFKQALERYTQWVEDRYDDVVVAPEPVDACIVDGICPTCKRPL